MIPGMNPRKMAQAMKRMGIQQQEIDAKKVIIELEDKQIIFTNPQVSKVNMMGQMSYQIVGDEKEVPLDREIEINEEDVKTVMEQTGISHDEAMDIIKKHEGDLASAIMELQENAKDTAVAEVKDGNSEAEAEQSKE